MLRRQTKCQSLWMPMPYVKRQKSKEVDVIAQDIEAAEKIEDYVDVLSCVWYMYYDMACYYIGIYFGTLPCHV